MQSESRWMFVAAAVIFALVGVFVASYAMEETGGSSDDGVSVGSPVGGDDDDDDGDWPPPPTPDEPAATPDTEAPGPGTHVQAVVTAHDLATQAGMDILEQGGSAADAAVAIATTLTVVEPWYSSALGGGTWALYYDAEENEVTALDGVATVGSNVSIQDYEARAGQAGMHQANVPGAWDGWMLWLEEYGRLDLGDVLAAAISAARDGYTIDATYAQAVADADLGSRPPAAAIYAPDGARLGQGDTVFQHDMADTFESLVAAYDGGLEDGRSAALQAARDYFYRGPIAEAIVDYSDELGGYLTLDDFHSFEASIVDPISIDYNDEVSVVQNPPNSQGITMLMALNILRDYDLAGMDPGSTDAFHLQIEATKLAFSDRYHHVGDPARIDVPVGPLLSEQHAERQRQRIDINQALSWPIADGLEPIDDQAAHTTTFSVVDRDGNGAAVTTSLGNQLFVVGDTGIHINNRMRFYSVEPGNANQIEPGYKVRHTSNPYMAFRNGQLYILGGNTGADIQAQGQAQQFVNIVDFGMSAQEAVNRPRWISMAFPATTYPWQAANILRVESGAPAGLIGELQARGHHAEEWFGDVGNASVIVIDEDGGAETGAEPRNGTSSGTVQMPE